MKVNELLEILGVLKEFPIPEGKNAAYRITDYCIKYPNIVFDGNTPYLISDSHYQLLKNEDIPLVIRVMIAGYDQAFVTQGAIKEAAERIRCVPELQIDLTGAYEKNKYLINAQNGVFDIRTKRLLPHDINYLFDYQLKAEYIPPEKRQLKTFNNYIANSFGEENREAILRIIGVACSSIRDCKKAIVILGPKNSGKSILLNLIELIVGEKYSASVPFDKLGNELELSAFNSNIRINLSRDIRLGIINNDGNFKSLISSERINSRRRHKDAVSIIPKVFCIAAANAYPRFKYADEACIDRILPIQIKGYTGEPDRELPAKLSEEKNEIFSAAVDTLKDFIDSGYDFCEPESSKLITKHQLEMLNTPLAFIKENFIIGEGGEVASKLLYEQYVSWCKANALPSEGKITFFDRIKMEFPIEYRKVKRGYRYINGFKGLKLKESAIYDEDINPDESDSSTDQESPNEFVTERR